MKQQPNPTYRVTGALRSRINAMAHQEGQRYGMTRREELIRAVEAQGKAGKQFDEITAWLDGIERGSAA